MGGNFYVIERSVATWQSPGRVTFCNNAISNKGKTPRLRRFVVLINFVICSLFPGIARRTALPFPLRRC